MYVYIYIYLYYVRLYMFFYINDFCTNFMLAVGVGREDPWIVEKEILLGDRNVAVTMQNLATILYIFILSSCLSLSVQTRRNATRSFWSVLSHHGKIFALRRSTRSLSRTTLRTKQTIFLVWQQTLTKEFNKLIINNRSQSWVKIVPRFCLRRKNHIIRRKCSIAHYQRTSGAYF